MSHIEYRDGALESVFCKGCGIRIQSRKMDNANANIRRAGNVVIREIPTMVTPDSNYREITLIGETPDGKATRHITHICADCLARVLTLDELNDYYTKDIDELIASGAVSQEHQDVWRSIKITAIDRNV